ncbi:MAG: helix-turn-helix domain-containing protein [Methylobacter sp.]|nr:helix-turn-helix domain-containing protein [Methylobacter sp.]
MKLAPARTLCPDCRLVDLCLPYGLHIDEVKQLARIVKNKRLLPPEEYLYLQGDECRSLYAVKSGSFRCFISNADGTEQTLGFYFPGELMGLDSLQHGRSTCSTVALETGMVCEVPLSRLNELCTEIPGLQIQMMRILGKEIASDHDQIVLLGHSTAKKRMATFLLMLSRRYGALGFSNTAFNLSMRRVHIANFLGLTIETVSRQLAELGKQGIITIKQRDVQINDLDLLKAIVEHCSAQQLYAGQPLS